MCHVVVSHYSRCQENSHHSSLEWLEKAGRTSSHLLAGHYEERYHNLSWQWTGHLGSYWQQAELHTEMVQAKYWWWWWCCVTVDWSVLFIVDVWQHRHACLRSHSRCLIWMATARWNMKSLRRSFTLWCYDYSENRDFNFLITFKLKNSWHAFAANYW